MTHLHSMGIGQAIFVRNLTERKVGAGPPSKLFQDLMGFGNRFLKNDLRFYQTVAIYTR